MQIGAFSIFSRGISDEFAKRVLEAPNVSSHEFDQVVLSKPSFAIASLQGIGQKIKSDLDNWVANNTTHYHNRLKEGVHLIGLDKDLFIHGSAQIYPGTIFDTRNGPVIIDKYVEIGQHSVIEGPAYIGIKSKINNARILDGCIIGRSCGIGGEVEASIIGDYSNKHHEGFIGHSILGKWVNIGAISTTSDLKNNYGNVRLSAPKNILSSSKELTVKDTGALKLGSIIGDCTKIGIGTMLNTGTVLDFGCNIFNGSNRKYHPSFSWGEGGEKYQLGRFIEDFKKVAARRNVTISDNIVDLVKFAHAHSDCVN